MREYIPIYKKYPVVSIKEESDVLFNNLSILNQRMGNMDRWHGQTNMKDLNKAQKIIDRLNYLKRIKKLERILK